MTGASVTWPAKRQVMLFCGGLPLREKTAGAGVGSFRACLLFLEYIQKINKLKQEPEFYNTLTTNCTTDVVALVRALGSSTMRYAWEVLLTGYMPRYVYELGKLDTRLPFSELRRQSRINPRAQAVGDDPAFSIKIRDGLPMPFER